MELIEDLSLHSEDSTPNLSTQESQSDMDMDMMNDFNSLGAFVDQDVSSKFTEQIAAENARGLIHKKNQFDDHQRKLNTEKMAAKDRYEELVEKWAYSIDNMQRDDAGNPLKVLNNIRILITTLHLFLGQVWPDSGWQPVSYFFLFKYYYSSWLLTFRSLLRMLWINLKLLRCTGRSFVNLVLTKILILKTRRSSISLIGFVA